MAEHGSHVYLFALDSRYPEVKGKSPGFGILSPGVVPGTHPRNVQGLPVRAGLGMSQVRNFDQLHGPGIRPGKTGFRLKIAFQPTRGNRVPDHHRKTPVASCNGIDGYRNV